MPSESVTLRNVLSIGWKHMYCPGPNPLQPLMGPTGACPHCQQSPAFQPILSGDLPAVLVLNHQCDALDPSCVCLAITTSPSMQLLNLT